MEQYFGTLKTETIYLDGNRKSLPLSFVMQILEDYIEFYNNERRRKNLGWLSPVAFRESAA